ncbi:MAG TPA: sterol desaturase family protein [Mucilaginibacter sp.]|jgi:sterol desaturase/sphingolipid hydroxylase (fatty acid hydroxylase superfamily)|nr:sterol desaturase family protein [Mucilaginibacter sp.]
MSFTKKLNKPLRIAENVVFLCGFVFIMYSLISTYGVYMYRSIKGEGYLGAILDPIKTHLYYVSAVSIVIIVNATLVLWEIMVFIVKTLKDKSHVQGKAVGYKAIFKKFSIRYKSTFLGLLASRLLPKVFLVHMFWVWLPWFQKFQFFTTGLNWYSWIYGYLCWEFSAWLFHFSSHRIRLLWCFHSPHHGPSELNMTVNWIHFFAESYYSTFVRLLVLIPFGVNQGMFLAIISIDAAWGIFIHVSEDALKDGRLGFLRHLVITPSHHRVHHAKNHLYLDTNFANVLPVWDWVMGTLQPIREEIKAEYGIMRELDVTNFSDLYFGELLLLWRDIKNADGIRNKFLHIFMPPGWTPLSTEKTALVLRQKFLETNPELGLTSRERIVTSLKSRFSGDKLQDEPDATTIPGIEIK